VTSRCHLEVELVTEYAVEDGIEKNDSKSCRAHEGLSFDDLDFELEVNLGTNSAS